ncbi:PepSY domain-containing protein [Rhizobium sp. ARZ01]|uniref:PepSY domain-containing protein n=1 Tax=Rhizobium sp. ARZ01 TaxID=2769313 RepID=UPI001785513B|nr:PepSY domain-containing protein [Rhizobium sp. ARZ01]MBD9375032.1 PepSY domain-containing protein [Rhizobium sp. ARZ01]
MKKAILLAAILLGGLSAGAAMADHDDCNVPMTNWQPREAVQKMAEARGWKIQRIKTDDGCYKIRAQDKDGRNIKAKIDPGTLAVVSMKFADDRDRKDHHHRDRGGKPTQSGTTTPPDNGLFNNKGTPPKVEVQ